MIHCRIEPTVVAEMTDGGSMPGFESRNAEHVIEPSSRDPSEDFREEDTESKFLDKYKHKLFSLKLFRTRVVVTYTTATQIIYTATATKTKFQQIGICLRNLTADDVEQKRPTGRYGLGAVTCNRRRWAEAARPRNVFRRRTSR